jgi:UDP-N-acetylmuramoyl-L-alanyl-D-glutamate--2,6-diaminopimelate ligase
MIDRPLTLDAVSEVLRSAGLLLESHGPGDVAVMGVCQDSRTVEAGDLFLAWHGTAVDAHDFVADAAKRGAVAAVVERVVDAPVPQLVVTDGRSAAARAAHLVLGSPSERLFLVGVTGTNGKTTTALLIRHLMAAREPAAAVGTLGVVDASGVRPGTEGLTTPGPVQLANWLRKLVDDGVRTVAMEASSHALEQHRLDGARFAAGVFTNLTQDHLDYHGDLDAYRDAKARLIGLVARDGVVVVNRDDRAWDALDPAGRAVRTFAMDAEADVRAENVILGPEGSRFTLVADGVRADATLPLLGAYNVENALAAATVALAAGMSLDEVVQGLGTVPQVAGRLEAVLTDPYAVLIDFAHTPDALEGALGAVKPLARGRLIVVFGAGGDRDRTKRRPMAEAVRRFADVVVLTSDNPRTEDPERILDDLAVGLEGADYVRIADRRQAIRHALSVARPGDAVVLAGKGHETYQVVGREKRPFDERVIVKECLAELGAA